MWFIWSTFSNLTLIGMDLTRYITVNPDFSIAWPSFLHDGVGGGQNLLFVPQAWTLAIELQFYLLAPFLVRLRARPLVLLTGALLVNRILVDGFMHWRGFPLDDASIFAMQLQYFLLGAVGYHGYRELRARRPRNGSSAGCRPRRAPRGRMIFRGWPS